MAPFARVSVSAQPVVTLASPYAIAGCTSTPPCANGQFVMGATRVLAGGAPVATLASQSVCIPTGTPMLPLMAQTRVLAT
jgi:hypothetical protein